MNDVQYQTFVHDHQDEIIAKIKELDNFEDADIAVLKRQILRGINIRKHMPVVPFEEIKQLMVGYIAIKFIEDELEFEF
jgi:N-acetyl-gamma-glutamylphosphate reductase